MLSARDSVGSELYHLGVFSCALIFHHEKMSSAESCQLLLKLMLRISFIIINEMHLFHYWNICSHHCQHCNRQCILFTGKNETFLRYEESVCDFSLLTIPHHTGVEALVVQVHVVNGVSVGVTVAGTLSRKCPDYSIYFQQQTFTLGIWDNQKLI